jgi:hypothetical protein
MRDCVASIVRPVKELKAFAKVRLEPGESRKVTLRLRKADMGFYDDVMDYHLEDGTFEFYVGGDSENCLKVTRGSFFSGSEGGPVLTENADKRESVHTFRLSFAELTVTVRRVGEDLLVLAEGGDKPHLGCTVLALPRPSLRGDGSVSCTSSVLNRAGSQGRGDLQISGGKMCCEIRYGRRVYGRLSR